MEIAIFLAAVAVVLSVIALVKAVKKKNVVSDEKKDDETYFTEKMKSFRFYFSAIYRCFPDKNGVSNFDKMDAAPGKGFLVVTENDLKIVINGKDENDNIEMYMRLFTKLEVKPDSIWFRVWFTDAKGGNCDMIIRKDLNVVIFRTDEITRKFVYNAEQIGME